jgi:hypothetical protein
MKQRSRQQTSVERDTQIWSKHIFQVQSRITHWFGHDCRQKQNAAAGNTLQCNYTILSHV